MEYAVGPGDPNLVQVIYQENLGHNQCLLKFVDPEKSDHNHEPLQVVHLEKCDEDKAARRRV
jgi:hypothetical protein